MNASNRSVLALSVSLMVLICLNADAGAGDINGRVLDASDGSPLVGATVWLEPVNAVLEDIGAETDHDGRFTIDNAPTDGFSLSITYIGFTPWFKSSSEFDPNSEIIVQLTPTAVNLNALTVSASRRPEKLVDAPAAVTSIPAEEVAARTSLSVADHLTDVPTVDVVSTGLNSSNVVVRGFNNIFSTSLLTMVDNRIARVPSLRLNAYQFIPTSDADIDRIEVVGGPGSALYGPNSANGVLHMITKSPLASTGTEVSVAGGERELMMGAVRHAGRSADGRIGFKVSGQYYQARDWNSFDPIEPAMVLKFQQSDTGNIYESDSVSNARDFDIENLKIDGRADFVLNDNATLVLNGGFNSAKNVELTGLGAGQADWTYGYAQARLTYKDLFGQLFVNGSSAGDTYLLRSGAKIVDDSRLYVGQLQHSYMPSDRQRFTYGIDALLTRPNSDRTINGRNEDDDDINEYGVYVQSETKLSDQWTFLAAGRFDDHNLLDDPVFSPRAALKFQPDENNTFRATFNQAYSTPSTLNFYLDVLSASVPTSSINPALIPVIGPTILNARGTGSKDGFTFNFGPDGRPWMVSLYGGALAGAGAIPSPNTYLSPDVANVWPAMRALLVAQDPSLDPVLPQLLSGPAPGQFLALNTVTGSFDPFDYNNVANLDPIEETKTTTYELGYKGVLGKKLAVSINGYYSEIKDFIGPLRVETPHVFINGATFVPQLTADIIATGVVTDPAQAQAIATGIATQLGPLPIGLVSPEEVQNPTDVIITYRNFGDIDLLGADIALDYHFNQYWTGGMTYSWLEENIFRNVDGIADIPVNAPQNKMTAHIKYRNARAHFNGMARARWIDRFPVNSGVYNGNIESYVVVDLNLDYEFARNTTAALTVQNIFDNRHYEFIGAPELGRLSILRITRTL